MHDCFAEHEGAVGFIGYAFRKERENDRLVRIFLECQEEANKNAGVSENFSPVSYTYAVDVIFPRGKLPCRLRGIDNILALKKFYKLVHSLEERAREHGNDWTQVMNSVEDLLEHLAYTRNVRDFTGQEEPRRRESSETAFAMDCSR
ncbi:MAG: hypothetical protein HY313_02255 [Acidobacteria bacterium]|nr:hypothetical protein [Acidobacteriota bacterium]